MGEGREHVRPDDRRCDGQITARQTLGEAHDVRDDIFVVASKPATGPPQSRGDLIGDQQPSGGSGGVGDGAQVTLRLHEHPSGPLDQRLHDHRRELVAGRCDGRARLLGVETQLADVEHQVIEVPVEPR